MLVTKEEKNKVSLNIILEKNEDFKDDQVIGKVQVLLNNENMHEEDIYIVRKKSIKKNSLWKKIKSWFS